MNTTTGGYRGKYSALAENSDGRDRKRKKRSSSDTSASSPHPHAQADGADFQPASKTQFQAMDLDGKLNCLFDMMVKTGPYLMNLDHMNESLYRSKAIHDVTEARLQLLEYKSLDVETRMLRSNLVITGLAEGPDEDSASVVSSFLQKHLKLKENEFVIVGAYRIGRRQVARGRQTPRAILVSFSDVRNVNVIMQNVSLLKGTSFGVSRDYPREIREARKALWNEYKDARNQFGARNVKLVFPAALKINGDTVRDLFPGWHTVLQGSRNSDIQARTELRYHTIVQSAIYACAKTAPVVEEEQMEPDDSSDSEQEPVGDTYANASVKTTAHTEPGYLLQKHPVMSGQSSGKSKSPKGHRSTSSAAERLGPASDDQPQVDPAVNSA